MKSKLIKVGIYCRTSSFNSSSINNQKEILSSYVKSKNWILHKAYIDEGYSGTNFNRPGFKNLIKDIKRGKLNVVITKDLSRLGREYIKTGELIEYIFPSYGIRYIAINDNYDSLYSNDDFIPFKNLINEYYARDISKKIRAVFLTYIRKGVFKNTTYPLYGYINKEDKRIIDSKSSYVVKLIFNLFNLDYKTKEITNYLNELNIPTPSSYLNMKRDNKDIWNQNTVISILKNEEYTGAYIKNKSVTTYKVRKVKHIPRKDQKVFFNRFEPIIKEDEYNKASIIFDSSYKELEKLRIITGLEDVRYITTLIKLICVNLYNSIMLNKFDDYDVLFVTCLKTFIESKKFYFPHSIIKDIKYDSKLHISFRFKSL